jgi:peptidyl-prolyl cis-trans isomerase D
MATLENIRKKGTLVAAVIGFALLAFILGDAVKSGSSFFRQSQFDIAKVKGKTLSVQDFNKKFDEVSEIYKSRSGGVLEEDTRENIRNQVWEQMLREVILGDEYKELGLAVSSDELYDMVQGNNIDPTIRQLFQNPETGEFNRGNVIQFLKNLDKQENAANRDYWLFIENEIKTKRIYEKYSNLIAKGLFVTDKETELENTFKSYKASIKYITESFNNLSDSAIKVPESEIKAYYEKHKKDYKQEESRDVEYVAFEIKPSSQDVEDTRKSIETLKEEFAVTENIEQFIKRNDPDNPFDKKHYKEDQLPTNLSVFIINAQINDVYGPYMENNSFKIAKLSEIKELSDTVKARHILIKVKNFNDKAEVDLAKAKIDSLKKLLKSGGDFEKLAKDNSMDGSASKGGDLGWFKEGDMVGAFNDSCFYGKKGDIKVIETQFGIHLVEIVDQGPKTKKYQIATLNRQIVASQETRDSIFRLSTVFASQNSSVDKFEKAIADQGLNKKLASNISPLAKGIPGLENARELVRAAFKAEKNTIIKDEQNNPIFEIGDNYIIAKLAIVREKGLATFDQVSGMLKVEVIKDKKGEMLSQKMKAKVAPGKTIESIASELSLEVKDAQDITFNSYQLQGAGFEPNIVAAATTLGKDKVSEPIIGAAGVFVISVTNTSGPDPLTNINNERNNSMKNLRSRANYQLYPALKEISEIEDMRAKFF